MDFVRLILPVVVPRKDIFQDSLKSEAELLLIQKSSNVITTFGSLNSDVSYTAFITF